jgi:ribonuclease R
VRSYGLSVELPDAMVTGLIHVSSLPDDFYEFDSTRLRFVGRKTRKVYKAGDALQVIVSRVDAYKRQIDFVPVGQPVAEGKTESFGSREALRDSRRGRKP